MPRMLPSALLWVAFLGFASLPAIFWLARRRRDARVRAVLDELEMHVSVENAATDELDILPIEKIRSQIYK